MEKYSRLIQFIAGLTGFMFGVLVYIIDRPPMYVPGFVSNLSLYNQDSVISFGSFANNLPSFFHTFSFCLLLSCMTSQTKIKNTQILAFWLFVEISFELMQGKPFKDWLVQTQFFKENSGYILRNISAFINNGFFDTFDVVAILLGATLAYLLMLITSKEEKNEKIA